jgi:hypothetical protein
MAKKLVASASKRKKKAQPAMNIALVSDYHSKLEATLGNDEEFSRIFSKLQNDPAITQLEAVAIGSNFVAPMAASTSNARAFERICKRHKNLLTFKLKQRAIGGRSAA